jgi:hypothetical protein
MHSPAVNIIQDFLRSGFTMNVDEILLNPHHEVVLESSLD